MNEHELSIGLRAIHHERASLVDVETMRRHVLAVPIQEIPQRRRWLPRIETGRFQAMYSATKFVVAGAIVALFGGFMLTGVSTQPTEERPLPVGWSPSPRSAPSDMMTAAPERSPGPATMISDPLPGVELVTDEIEPGLHHVMSDGLRRLSGRVQDVAIDPSGDVWVEVGRAGDWRVVRLGDAGRSQRLGRKDPWLLGMTSDGRPVVTGGGRRLVLDGRTWVETEATAFDPCVLFHAGVVGRDGRCWLSEGDPVRIERDGTRANLTPAETGLEPDFATGFLSPALGPDGTVWYRVHRATTRAGAVFEGLLAYDGSLWSFVPYEDDDAEEFDGSIAVDAANVVWVSRSTNEGPPILRWDGGSWTSYMVGEDPRSPYLWSWPNGVLWFGEVATRWDGKTLNEVEPPISVDVPQSYALGGRVATAPDGSLWTVIDHDLYVVARSGGAAAE